MVEDSDTSSRRVDRRDFIKTAAIGGATLALQGCSTSRSVGSSRQPPNIVLILADDLGWNDVGYHGSEIRTPNIDRIAGEGVELNRFYATPICSPTRCGMLTGRSPIRYGRMRAVIPPWRDMGLPVSETTLPTALAETEAGYSRRACFGKWHLGHSDRRFHPLNRGFTHFYGHYNGAIDYFSHKRSGELDWHEGFETSYDEGYTTDLLTERAVDFIDDSSGRQNQFFMYLPYNAPHSPLQVPDEALRKYPNLEEGERQTYAGMVSRMDAGIGRILHALERAGVADNTVVWFISDNGGNENAGGSNEPLRGAKQTTFEGGIRVPAAIRWPSGGLLGGHVVEAPLAYTDVFPTVLRMAGAASYKSPKPLDGQDVLSVMRGDTSTSERLIPFYWGQNGRTERGAMVGKQWKLVYDDGPAILNATLEEPEHLHLFNIREDPRETANLLEKRPEVAAQLLRRMKAFRRLQPEEDVLPPWGKGRRGFVAPEEWNMRRFDTSN